MCKEIRINIKNYKDINTPYTLEIDKTEYDRDNLSLYFLIKKAMIDNLNTCHIDSLSQKLLNFENNLVIANAKKGITSNKGQIFTFNDKGEFQIEQRHHIISESFFEKINKFLSKIMGDKK